MVRDNPADRLRLFMQSFTYQPDQLALAGCAAYFGLDESDKAGIMEALARMALLPSQIERQLRAHTSFDPEVHLEWRSRTDSFCEMLFLVGGQYNRGLSQTFDGTTLYSLRVAASVIAREGVELPEESVADLDNLLRELDEAIRAESSLMGSGGDLAMRELLLRLVFEMRQSIDLIKASGADGLQKAYEQLLGAMGNLRMQGRTDDIPQSVKDKLYEVAVRYETILSLLSSGYQLGAGMAALFGVGS